MNRWKKVTGSNFLIKLKSWEYWPFWIIQLPAIIYWLWLSIRARSLVFFSASNPGIPMGGMFGESKYDVLKKIPGQYVPNTILVSIPASAREVCAKISAGGLRLPVIFKPDIGERGFMVKKVSNEKEIEDYLRQIKVSFIIQECIQLPLEYGIFYTKFPGHQTGKVTSVVAKEMLSIVGNGKSTVKELIFRNNRARLQWKTLKSTYHNQLGSVIPPGEKFELVPIGNHALGAKFTNANHLINDRLSNTFEDISSHISGFYFGRFDLRCASVKDLYDGKIKIMELNGCGAEPAHIYDPGFSLREALSVLFIHWSNIFKIASANKRQGVKYASHKEALAFYRKFKAATK
jgi:hypothetical protein